MYIAAPPRRMTAPPSIALVIPTYNGASYVEACLDSVAALDYPRDRLETIVVDNGSTDGTSHLLSRRYPWVRGVALERNTGFAAACNAGARAATANCLALANNDMRLDPLWLRELVAAFDPPGGFPCVAGLILDATGDRVDFADAYVNFYGMGSQGGFGRALEDVEIVDRRELLFACGGSMLVDRALFLELGGFDETFFAYFEDVDFGWRLWLAGHRTRLAAGARSFHRHHGTADVFPQPQRTVLYDRNSLLMLAKNLDDANLHRVLAAALCLTAERALADSGADPSAYVLGGPAPPDRETVPANAVARLNAVSQFVRLLDHALAERKRIQALRHRPDSEIFAQFRRPFWPLYRSEERYLETSILVAEAFGMAGLFDGPRDDVEVLEAVRRARLEAPPPPSLTPARAAWSHVPEPIRRALRPLLRRLRSSNGG